MIIMSHVTSFIRFAAVLTFTDTLAACNDSRTAAVVEWNEFASKLIAGNGLLAVLPTDAAPQVAARYAAALESIPEDSSKQAGIAVLDTKLTRQAR